MHIFDLICAYSYTHIHDTQSNHAAWSLFFSMFTAEPNKWAICGAINKPFEVPELLSVIKSFKPSNSGAFSKSINKPKCGSFEQPIKVSKLIAVGGSYELSNSGAIK